MRRLAPFAVITAAILWSFDGLIRQNLSGVSALQIVFLEHLLGALLFAPLLVRAWGEIKKLDRLGWGSVVWVPVHSMVTTRSLTWRRPSMLYPTDRIPENLMDSSPGTLRRNGRGFKAGIGSG